MNSDYDKQLEADINRELNNLPDLAAPDSLVNRVLAAIDRRSKRSWYPLSWQTWPAAMRWASLAAMLMLFAGLCVGGWKLSQTESIMLVTHRLGDWYSALNTIGDTLNVLVGSGILVLKKLGTGFMIACLFGLGLGYAMCVGLGTLYVRLALSKT